MSYLCDLKYLLWQEGVVKVKHVILIEQMFSHQEPLCRFSNSPGGSVQVIAGLSPLQTFRNGKTSSGCQIYSSDLKEWVPLPL